MRLYPLLLASTLVACAPTDSPAPPAPVAEPTTSGQQASSGSPPSPPAQAGAAQGLVLDVREGGAHPDRFCTPQWRFDNRSGADLPGILVAIEWRRASTSEVLQAGGEFGQLIENLADGESKDLTLMGYEVDCRDLEIVVGGFACRDANAVRMPCPAPLVVQADGQVRARTDAMAEGPMKGAVEPQ